MIQVLRGDITGLTVDAIVNAANQGLLGGGGVDGAIHRVAGLRLKPACQQLGGCPTGQVRMTPGFNLPSKWVIHTVGPVWQGGTHGEATLLESCYTECFKLALTHDIASLAFPAIGTGVYGYPKGQAATIALSVMRRYQDDFETIIACCYSQQDTDIYLSLL